MAVEDMGVKLGETEMDEGLRRLLTESVLTQMDHGEDLWHEGGDNLFRCRLHRLPQWELYRPHDLLPEEETDLGDLRETEDLSGSMAASGG